MKKCDENVGDRNKHRNVLETNDGRERSTSSESMSYTSIRFCAVETASSEKP